MRSAARAEFALVDTPALMCGLFRPLPRASTRKKLDVSFEFGGLELRWRGPDQLGAQDQSVLLGLLALAGQSGLNLDAQPATEMGGKVRANLQAGGWAAEASGMLLQTSWSALARASGLGTSGKDLAQVRASIARLAEVTLWLSKDGKHASTRLVSYMLGDIAGVSVALNFRLARAMSGQQHTRVDLLERWRLAGDTARVLHAALCALPRKGTKRRYRLSVLERAVFGEQGAGSTGRDRRRRLLDAIAEIDGLAGWRVDFEGTGRTVTHVEIERDPSGFDRRTRSAPHGKSPSKTRDIAVDST